MQQQQATATATTSSSSPVSDFVSDYTRTVSEVIRNFSSLSIFSPKKASRSDIQQQEEENMQFFTKYLGKYRREDNQTKYTKAENNPLSSAVVATEPLHILRIKDVCEKLQHFYDRCAIRNMGSADQVCQDEFQATQKCLSKLKKKREEQFWDFDTF